MRGTPLSLEFNSEILVREAMSSPVISVQEHSDIVEVAHLMKHMNVGAVIVLNKEAQPVGIVTERDLVNRVIAEGRAPKEVEVKSIMSSPLKMVEPEMNLLDAMSLMDKMKIRRLGVTYKGQLVGVISDRNIIRLIPTIVEIMKERQEILFSSDNSGPSIAGYCNQCEIYSNNLRSVDGQFICEDCRIG